MRSIIRFFRLLFLTSCVLFSFDVSSHTAWLCAGVLSGDKPLRVPRIDSELSIDGVIDEEEWKRALLLDVNYEVRPGENIPPPARTEVLLLYSSSSLYAAFRAYDPDPSAIRSRFTDRDNIFQDDWVEIVLDTFNDERRAYDFMSNPFGVQGDFIEGSQVGIGEWDGIWDSAARITEWGYTVEMAVPFSTLSFQHSDGDQVWGFDAVRSFPRSVRHHIGLFPRDRNNSCYLCQTEKLIGFAGAAPGKNLELDPTLSGLVTQEREGETEGPFVQRERKLDPGLTLRWGFTPNLTLSTTANPDFSQVEADAAQLDINTQFALFFPEKRPFFLEGADFFRTRRRVVHTRALADPSWGIKLSGKEGRSTVGLFIVRDEVTNFIIPGSEGSSSQSLDRKNYGTVLRYRGDVFESSTLGVIMTDREGEDYYNRIAGLDGDLRLTRSERIRFQVIGTRTRYPAALLSLDEDGEPDPELPDGSFGGAGGEISYSHDARNLDWYAEYRDIRDGFRTDLGFITQVGIRRVELGSDYKWWGEADRWYSEIEIGMNVDRSREQDGSLLEEEAEADLSYEGPLQSSFRADFGRRRKVFEDVGFDQNFQRFDFHIRPSGVLFFQMGLDYGDHIDFAHTKPAVRLRLDPSVEYRAGRHLTLSLDHTYERLDRSDGRLFTANLSQVKAVYQFDTRTFLRVIIQYLDLRRNMALYADDDVESREQHLFSQILFSYKINPQTVFFLGYSDNYEGTRDISLIQTDRSLFAKIGYAWVI